MRNLNALGVFYFPSKKKKKNLILLISFNNLAYILPKYIHLGSRVRNIENMIIIIDFIIIGSNEKTTNCVSWKKFN